MKFLSSTVPSTLRSKTGPWSQEVVARLWDAHQRLLARAPGLPSGYVKIAIENGD